MKRSVRSHKSRSVSHSQPKKQKSNGGGGIAVKVFLFALLALFLYLGINLSRTPFGHAESDNLNAQLAQQTGDLLNLANQYSKADPVDQEDLLVELSAAVEARRAIQLQAMPNDPGLITNYSLPGALRNKLPASLVARLEEPITLDGAALIAHGDDLNTGESTPENSILDAAGNRYKLNFVGGEPKDISTDDKITVTGVRLDKEVAVQSAKVRTKAASLTAAALTHKKVAVILFNFSNNPTAQPYTTEAARTQIFGTTGSTASTFFSQGSFDKWDIQGHLNPTTGDVFGWYTLTVDNATCNYTGWETEARTKAAANGFVASNYNNIMYGFPQASSCGWAGLGTVGGAPGRSWINYATLAPRVTVHELGHNFRAAHANTLTCLSATGSRVPISADCTTSEYADIYSAMGNSSNVRQFDTHTKAQTGTGWVTSGNIQTVSSSGSYTIAPLEATTSSVQTLRIPRGYAYKESGTTVNVTDGYYSIDYRQPSGNFDTYTTTEAASNGVMLRLTPSLTTYDQTHLIDTVSSTTSFTDAPLLLNQTYTDTASGITIALTGKSTTSATVQVTMGPVACTRANPGLTISPTTQQSSAGGTLTYSFTLTNNDTASCSPSTFSVTPTLPSGWSQTPATPFSEPLSPGSSVTRTFLVTSLAEAPAGDNTITQTAVNTNATSFQKVTNATYKITVAGPPEVAITSPQEGDVLPSRGSVSISSTASDADGIATIVLSVNGKTVRTCKNATACSYSWQMGKLGAGEYIIRATAKDKVNDTATASVLVTKPAADAGFKEDAATLDASTVKAKALGSSAAKGRSSSSSTSTKSNNAGGNGRGRGR